jgi:hypothetical protein
MPLPLALALALALAGRVVLLGSGAASARHPSQARPWPICSPSQATANPRRPAWSGLLQKLALIENLDLPKRFGRLSATAVCATATACCATACWGTACWAPACWATLCCATACWETACWATD